MKITLKNFTSAVSGTLREVLDNDTTTRDKFTLKGFRVTKGRFGCVDIVLKTGMKLAQYYSAFNYGPPILQNNIKSQLDTKYFFPREQ